MGGSPVQDQCCARNAINGRSFRLKDFLPPIFKSPCVYVCVCIILFAIRKDGKGSRGCKSEQLHSFTRVIDDKYAREHSNSHRAANIRSLFHRLNSLVTPYGSGYDHLHDDIIFELIRNLSNCEFNILDTVNVYWKSALKFW